MSSIDLTDLAINAHHSRRNNSESVPPRGASWDDFSLFYQTSNECDYPINQYKSQNPSPKHDCLSEHREISPLSTGFGLTFQRDSETEDMDTTSASSISPRAQIVRNTPRRLHLTHSMEDTMDTSDDYADPQNTFKSPSDNTEYNEDGKIHEDIDVVPLTLYGGEDGDNEGNHSHTAIDIRLVVMELQLNDMNEKILHLMETIRDLKDKNSDLERSKLCLIENTANAMNQYRDTVKKLNQQNQLLVSRINRA